MKDVLTAIDAWTVRGAEVAVATVVGVKRSAPRPVGAKLAVSDTGALAGAVSGGCVEGAVVRFADRILRGGAPELLRFGIDDEEAWSVGLPCVGEIDIYVAGPRTPGSRKLPARTDAPRWSPRCAGHAIAPSGSSARTGRPRSLGDDALDAAADADADELMWIERSELREHGNFELLAAHV